MWNGFRILERNLDFLRKMLNSVWEELTFIEDHRGNHQQLTHTHTHSHTHTHTHTHTHKHTQSCVSASQQ